jgi:hypothetical protein
MAAYLEFVRTPTYEADIAGMLTAEAERNYVENPLIADPFDGATLAGTGGFRKLRIPLEGRGKRGGGRVVYYYAGSRGRIYLVAFFPKNVQENLTKAEHNALKQFARELESEK